MSYLLDEEPCDASEHLCAMSEPRHNMSPIPAITRLAQSRSHENLLDSASSHFLSCPDSVRVLDSRPPTVSNNLNLNSTNNHNKQQGTGYLDRLRRFLRVESDDSDDIHNKYKDTEKLMAEKLDRLERELNLKDENSSVSRSTHIMDSNMSICLLFLSIVVLLLLLVFLTFKLSSRVEVLESMCEEIGNFIEQFNSNKTEMLLVDRANPGIMKGRSKGKRKSRLDAAGPG